MSIPAIRCALCAAFVAGLAVLAQMNDRHAQQLTEARITVARAEMAGRGVCGTGGQLALLSDGYACLHQARDGRTISRPVYDQPTQLARR